jgi:hypothetical protein
MKLIELNPLRYGTLQNGKVRFDCPTCRIHSITITVSDQPYHERDPRDSNDIISDNGKVKVWQASGVFPDTLTLQPSVNIQKKMPDGTLQAGCWHGHVTNGEIT